MTGIAKRFRNDSTGDSRQADGARAEDSAARHLASCGLKIIARNYRSRAGEIDLVCRDGPMLVFVEVRLRRHAGFGGAAASIDAGKQRRIALAAAEYLAEQCLASVPCRFDCVLLASPDGDGIEWIRDAFAAD